jgi:hypothetical protein
MTLGELAVLVQGLQDKWNDDEQIAVSGGYIGKHGEISDTIRGVFLENDTEREGPYIILITGPAG